MTNEPDPPIANEIARLRQENARLRGDLLTVARRVSHDLRTPLGGIITTGEMLKEILADHDASEVPLIAPLFDSAEGMAKLIESVSFVLKASANPFASERIKMGDVVFTVLQRLERKILNKKAVLSEPAGWPEVDGVFPWLEVIWLQLVANALQHGHDRIELGWEKAGDEFRFQVCDNGGGVSALKRPKLFQPFHRLHEPDATAGLGLSVVHRLVELQGGRCGYEPGTDGGSCFYFTLPASTYSLSESPAPE